MFILEATAIAIALSLDAFAASFAYGSNKIRMPMRSIQTINFLCSGITGLSLLLGNLLQPYLPAKLTIAISFTILLLLGLVKLFDSFTKSMIKKNRTMNHEIRFSMCNLKFILSLYADPEIADVDSSKTLSPAEASSLAIALSLDGIAVGFGAALVGISAWAIVLCSLITNMIALYAGVHLGNKLASKTKLNLSWLGGVILIVMAFSKLL